MAKTINYNQLFDSKQLGEVPYVDEDDDVIILTGIKFPHHYKVNDWINGTDRNADFTIVITHIEKGKHLQTAVGVKPTTPQVLFYWKLHGLEKLEQEILDFKPER